jgi:hypothetical protein
MATWMLSADQQLLNLDAVEFLDVIDVYPDDADPEAVDAGTVTPAYAELVAHMGSGDEVVMFDDEDPEVVLHALELLKGFLAAGPMIEATRGGQILSVQDLVDRASAQKN